MKAWITLSRESVPEYRAGLMREGYEAFHDPLLKAMPILHAPYRLPYKNSYLIVTSSNALHALEELGLLDALRENPLITIGWHTPHVAKKYGFQKIINAGNKASEIPQTLRNISLPYHSEFFYFRGQDIAFALKEAIDTRRYFTHEIIVYKTEPQIPSLQTQAWWHKGEIGAILVGSPKAARALRQFLKQENPTRARGANLFYLGDDVAEALQEFPWKSLQHLRRITSF